MYGDVAVFTRLASHQIDQAVSSNWNEAKSFLEGIGKNWFGTFLPLSKVVLPLDLGWLFIQSRKYALGMAESNWMVVDRI